MEKRIFYKENAGDDSECKECPLYKILGTECDNSSMPFMVWNYDNDAKPMVKALKQVVRVKK